MKDQLPPPPELEIVHSGTRAVITIDSWYRFQQWAEMYDPIFKRAERGAERGGLSPQDTLRSIVVDQSSLIYALMRQDNKSAASTTPNPALSEP